MNENPIKDKINISIDQKAKNVDEVLKSVFDKFQEGVVFSSSFGSEDQVLTDIIVKGKFPVNIFTIDTGRLFNETIELHRKTTEKYGLQIKTFFPRFEAVEKMLNDKGQNSFYDSVENRKECCNIRKVEPLQRALKNNKVWITGIRADQSADRKDTPIVEWDNINSILKVHPLLNWSEEEVWQYIQTNNVPSNILHKQNYVSIGCAPCTRPVLEGEDPRSGRWWWESDSHKECGLHIKN